MTPKRVWWQQKPWVTIFLTLFFIVFALAWNSRRYLPRTLIEYQGKIYRVAFSPDGKTLATGSSGWQTKDVGMVQLWDVSTLKLKRTLQMHSPSSEVCATFFVGPSQIVAVDEKNLYVWDTRDGHLVKKIANVVGMTKSWERLVEVSPNHRFVASYRENRARVWNIANGKLQRVFSQKDIDYIEFAPDSRSLFITSGNTKTIWNLETGRLVEHQSLTPRAPSMIDLSHAYDIMVFSPNGKIKAEGRFYQERTFLEALNLNYHMIGGITLYDAQTDRKLRDLPDYNDGVRDIAFSPDGRYVACNGGQIWDISDLN